jgi:preprotein translocase subunit SecD
MNPIRSFVTLVANAASPKLVLAVAISSAVTGGVAGPLAYQAFHARDVAQQAATAQQRQQNQQKKESKGSNEIAGGTTTTTSTSTTTTTTMPASTTTTSEPRTTTTEAAAPSTTTTTTVPASVPILVSVSPDHAPAESLDGTQLSGQVYVFAEVPTDASVTYSIDGSPPAPTLEPLDTTPLDTGEHTIAATVTQDESSVTQSVSFTVVH